MKYNMTEPCDACPFLKGGGFTWHSLIGHASGAFACHKTCETEEGIFKPTEKSLHCAGALIFLEKQGKPHLFAIETSNFSIALEAAVYLKGADLAYLKGADLKGAIGTPVGVDVGEPIKKATPEESIRQSRQGARNRLGRCEATSHERMACRGRLDGPDVRRGSGGLRLGLTRWPMPC